MSGENWLVGWTYRKSHLITASAGAGLGYCKRVKVLYDSAAANNDEINLATKCATDFGDVRFTDNDGNTVLSCWLESKTNSNFAYFWFKVNDTLESNATIYIYYGKTAQTTTSDFDATFIFGDPFDNATLNTNRWISVDGTPVYSINATTHVLEVTNMATSHWWDGVGFHSKTGLSLPTTWIIEHAYGAPATAFTLVHDSAVNGEIFGAGHSLHHTAYNDVTDKGVAYANIGDSWAGDKHWWFDCGVGGLSDYNSGEQSGVVPITKSLLWKKIGGSISIIENGTQRVNEANSETPDRVHLIIATYTTYGFGTETFSAFKIRPFVASEPANSTWGNEEVRKTVTDSIDVQIASRKVARWLANWTYRRFNQINPATGAGTDYQKRMVAKYDDNWENIRFATEGVAISPPDGTEFISGQTATYWDGGYLHVWYGASDDGLSDTDKIYYTYSKPPFTTWTIPVCVIDRTGSGEGIRDPTSYISGTVIYLFTQGYTTSGGLTHPIRVYKINTTDDFANSGNYTHVGIAVDIGVDGEYDEIMVASPCIMKSGATYYMMYEALDDDGVYSIGRATSADLETWAKDGQLDDSIGNPIANPDGNTNDIVPCAFHSSTQLYVHIGGTKLRLRGVIGDFVNNSVALEAYNLDPQIDGYWNHNALSETAIDANGFRNKTVYLLGAWSTATYYLRVYIDYDCFLCNTNCQTDFDDIRFTTGDGQTLLDYCLEQKTNSDYAIFWVEIPDSLESDAFNMYVYYGNSSATSLSDPAVSSLWNLGDNFNDNSRDAKWTLGEYHSLEGGLGAIDEVNNQLEVTALKAGDEAWYVSTDVVDASGCVIRLRTTNAQNLGQMGLWIIPTQYTNVDLWTQLDWYRVLIYGDGNIYIQSKDSGTLYSASFLATTDVVIIKIVGGHIYFYEQDKDYPWLVYLRADEAYTLADTDVYVYLEGKCDNGAKLGPEIHDDFFSRKMIATEPAQGAWEEEETENSHSIDVIFKMVAIPVTTSIDTVFKKLGITKTDSIDVLFGKLGLTETYSIDVILKSGITTKYITYDIDTLLAKQGLTKTDSIDALFKKLGVTKTNSIDVIFKRLILIKTYSTDILFKKGGIVKIDSIDVLFKKIGITKAYPIDVEIASRLISTDSIDILFKITGITKIDSIDILFKKLAIPITDSIDVMLKKLKVTKTDSIDVLLQKSGIIKTDSIDILFKKLEITSIYPIDIEIASRLISIDSIDTLFEKTGVVITDSIDTLFKKIGVVVTDSIDVLFEASGITKTNSIDVLFKKLGLTTTDSIDTLLKILGVIIPYDIDVLTALRFTSTDDIDVLFKKLDITKIDSVDTLFKKLGITNAKQIDVILSKYSATITDQIDVLLQKQGLTVVDSIDVLFKKLGVTKTNLIDVQTALRQTTTDSIDALLQKLGLTRTDDMDILLKRLSIIVNQNWMWKKGLTINYASNAGTNYPVCIKVYYGNGTDGTESFGNETRAKVYLNGECRTDFGDVRFKSEDGKTDLDYWLAEKVNGNYALFWVEVKEDLSTVNRTIYIWYGNPNVTTTSNGFNTFSWFDDFETLKTGSGDKLWTVNGVVVLDTSYVYEKIKGIECGQEVSSYNGYLDNRFAQNQTMGKTAIMFYDRMEALAEEGWLVWDNNTTARYVGVGEFQSATKYVYNNGTGWLTSTVNRTVGWHLLEIEHTNLTYFYIDGVQLANTGVKLTNAMRTMIGAVLATTRKKMYFDAFWHRKCVRPEPAFGSWTSKSRVEGSYDIDVLLKRLNISTIRFDHHGSGKCATGQSSWSWTHIIGGDANLVVIAVTRTGQNIVSVKVGGQNATYLTRFTDQYGNVYLEFWYKYSPLVGTQTITVTLGGTGNSIQYKGASCSYANTVISGTPDYHMAYGSGPWTPATETNTITLPKGKEELFEAICLYGPEVPVTQQWLTGQTARDSITESGASCIQLFTADKLAGASGNYMEQGRTVDSGKMILWLYGILGLRPKYSYDIDVLFKKLGLTKTDSIDTLLRKLGIMIPYDIDVVLKKLSVIKTYLADLIMKKLGIEIPYYLDVLFKRNEIANGYLIDAFLSSLKINKEYLVDSLIEKLGITQNTGIDVLLVKLEKVKIGGGHPEEIDRRISEGIVKYIERNFNFKVIALKVVSIRHQQKIPTKELQIAQKVESKKPVSELKVIGKSSHSNRTAELDVAKSYSQSTSLNELAIAKECSQSTSLTELAVAKEQSYSITLVELQLSKEQIVGFGIDPLNILSERGMTFTSAGLDIVSNNTFSFFIEPLSTRKKKMTKRELMDLLDKLDELDE
jgi:antitoxin component of RelBE/YafQ-DinJ toxin-antitoxin module